MKTLKEKCEICGLESDIDIIVHHINSRSKGGSEKESNKIKICTSCHNKIHHGILIIEGIFNSTDGWTVVYRNWNEESVTKFKDPEVWLYPNAKVFNLKKYSKI